MANNEDPASRTAADSPKHRTPQNAPAGGAADRRPADVGGASRLPWWVWVVAVLLFAAALAAAVLLRADDNERERTPEDDAPPAVTIDPGPAGGLLPNAPED